MAIYDGELNCYEAAVQYKIDYSTARDYMRLYRDSNHLPAKKMNVRSQTTIRKAESSTTLTGLEDYESMSKEELVHELIIVRINEARLKKDTR